MKESSEVLARKYRPSNFDELIGQETIAQTLSLSLDSNRLSHAYLFSGLRGSGKTSTARIFAKALICEEGMKHNPCGVCSNCTMALENRHMDIIEMDGASNRGIDDIRDLVEQTKYKPAVARFKIFIIDEVHMLTAPAFNALLKTLEEPPAYVKFILATTDPLKLPATILSRTQHFRFKSIATKKIIDHLIHILTLENVSYEVDALEILARSGSGSLRDTLTLLDQAIIFSKSHVDVVTVTDMLGLVDPKFIADIFTSVFSKDYNAVIEHTKALEDYEAEMVVDELIAYLKEKMYNQDALFSTLVIDRFFRILSDSKYLFSINADGSFVLSMIFFKMMEALRIKEIDQMIESLQKEISRPTIKMTHESEIPQTEIQVETPGIIENSNTSGKEEVTVTPKIQITTATQEIKPQPEVKPENKKFLELVAKIKDRSYELGEVFETSVNFVSFENSILTWESCADEEGKKALKYGYSAIKQLVREIYGFETKIKGLACSKEIKPTVIPEPKKTQEDAQASSMIEEAEVGGSNSCVTSCGGETTPVKEIDGADILNDPIVQRATELFEATKRTIQNKI
ncbi:DNA polymerase III subunit gamma/tau [Sulfurimonas sp. SAG-AH-194-I05]|nr:DNA polymerase III subunit gamma/tau [Sulfurimonas sp. SAG-AH-194-I05]MDF1875024.1 DNA polymerase III subunit gamma/tau [Sulfurimonas sp. SAG-AH-194-I05]